MIRVCSNCLDDLARTERSRFDKCEMDGWSAGYGLNYKVSERILGHARGEGMRGLREG